MILKSTVLIFLLALSYPTLAADQKSLEDMRLRGLFAAGVADAALNAALDELVVLTAWIDDEGSFKDRVFRCDSSGRTFDPKMIEADKNLVDQLCESVPPEMSELRTYHPGASAECRFRELSPCSVAFEKNVTFAFQADVLAGESPRFSEKYDAEHFRRGALGLGGSSATPIKRNSRTNSTATEFASVGIYCYPVALLGVQPRWICAAQHNVGWWINDEVWDASSFGTEISEHSAIRKLVTKIKPSEDYYIGISASDDNMAYKLANQPKVLKRFLKILGLPQ